ncbi:MAG TPA: response regulator [Acidimicrobiales bacterium]|nr:response regulator [Acidimicrobiales bacterium]
MPKVVIAEDEAIIRLDLREILEEEGYEVVGEAVRGDEALDKIRDQTPDIAILDIKMPGMDGLAVARAVSQERICAVLILTAFSQRNLIEEARNAGALAYLVKPFQKSDLVPAIEVALGRFAEREALENEVAELRDEREAVAEKLETRKVLDRAKGLLMDEAGLKETDAFRFIQKAAMDRRISMKEAASKVVSGEFRP